MATQHPQHDTEGRSATILPGVPMPEWALPAGPIAPEPEPAAELAPPVEAPAPAPEPEPELVLAGAPARPSEAEATAVAEPLAEAGPSSYAAALPVGANGPGPMRAGWDYPGSDLRGLAHDEAVADAAEAADAADAAEAAEALEDVDAGPTTAMLAPSAFDERFAEAFTAPVPQLEPLPATELEPTAEHAPEEPEAPGSEQSAVEAVETSAPGEIPAPADLSGDVVPAEGAEETEATPSSRRTLVALGALGAVLVAGAVAAFVWPGLLVTQDPAPVPVGPSASGPAPVTLTTPASVGPYSKLAGAPATALTAAVSGSALPGLSAPVSAVYGTGATPAVTVIAWTSAAPSGASSIPSAFAGFQGATSAVVTDITSTPVSAAGEMRCGTTVVQGAPASLCFWTDETTFGSVTVLKPASPESAADTAVAVRAAVVGG